MRNSDVLFWLILILVGAFLFTQAYIGYSINKLNSKMVRIEKRIEWLDQNVTRSLER